MAWTLAPAWLKPIGRRAPSPIAPDTLREAALAWRDRLAGVPSGRAAATLGQSIDHLDHDLARKPRVAILGEFNAGKTSLANILARTATLDTHVLANTRIATLVHHADEGPEPILVPERRTTNAGRAIAIPATAPFEYAATTSRADLLRTCSLLDTPGLSDPTHAEEAGHVFARIADIAVWCSIASHCWRETERQAWDSFSGRLRRYGVLVLTGADAVPAEAERKRILQRLDREAAGRFGRIVFLASHDAQRALDPETGRIVDPGLWRSSGAAETEEVMRSLVGHVARERALRCRRWAVRLLRQLSETPHAQLAAAWWLGPLVSLSDRLRMTAMALRGRRIARTAALAGAKAGLDQVRMDLTGHLARLGRRSVIEQIEASISRATETLETASRTGTEAALGEAINSVATRIFHEIAQIMRTIEEERVAIAAFERHLLTLVGSNNGRRTAPSR